jgi:flagellar basal-body rod protein FlgB
MNQVLGIMSRALDAAALRQKVISNNIANVETPNFQPTKVSFEDLFRQELTSTFNGTRTNEKHIAIGGSDQLPAPQLIKENTVMNNNGNGVDLDGEMTEMTNNSLWYQSLTYGVNEEFNLLKMSIKGNG